MQDRKIDLSPFLYHCHHVKDKIMYGLDRSMSFQFLIGKELLQICIGLYQLYFNFTEHVVITTECIMRLTDIDGSEIELSSDNPNFSKHLVCLLGTTVENIFFENQKELTLLFSQGYRLTITDSNINEESFSITTPEQEIIV